jgi:hypothetical protein
LIIDESFTAKLIRLSDEYRMQPDSQVFDSNVACLRLMAHALQLKTEPDVALFD